MATDVKNSDGSGAGNNGSTTNGRVTVRGSKLNFQHQDAAGGNVDYSIAKFDLKYSDTSDAKDAADLADRFDDVRYYQGDIA